MRFATGNSSRLVVAVAKDVGAENKKESANMKKGVSNEIARDVQMTRTKLFAAFKSVEDVRAEINKNSVRLEKVVQKVCETSEQVEVLRASSISAICEYEKELERVAAESNLRSEAKAEKKRVQQEHERWELDLRNARTRRKHETIKKLEASEPMKPEDVAVPEIKPVGKNIEARGLVASYDLSVAINDYVLAVAARRECKEREVELLALLDERERELIETRKEYEIDVNRTIGEYERRERVAQEERKRKIAALKASRDAANVGLKQMGAE